MPDPNERRWKVVYVGEHAVVDLFNWRDARFVSLPKLPLPEGYLVVGVAHCWERRAFAFCIEHESFPAVPEGEIIPEVGGALQVEYVTVPVPGETGDDLQAACQAAAGFLADRAGGDSLLRGPDGRVLATQRRANGGLSVPGITVTPSHALPRMCGDSAAPAGLKDRLLTADYPRHCVDPLGRELRVGECAFIGGKPAEVIGISDDGKTVRVVMAQNGAARSAEAVVPYADCVTDGPTDRPLRAGDRITVNGQLAEVLGFGGGKNGVVHVRIDVNAPASDETKPAEFVAFVPDGDGKPWKMVLTNEPPAPVVEEDARWYDLSRDCRNECPPGSVKVGSSVMVRQDSGAPGWRPATVLRLLEGGSMVRVRYDREPVATPAADNPFYKDS